MHDSSLDLLIELAHKAQDTAARALASHRQAVAQTSRQLQTLKQYHQEYRQTLQQKLHKEGMTPAALANYSAFLTSLDRALDRAGQTLAKQQEEVDKSQLNWQAQWRRSNAFATLGDRRREEALRQAGRVEQRHNDELSARMQQYPGVFARAQGAKE